VDHAIFAELLKNIHHRDGNLNQIAKVANSNGDLNSYWALFCASLVQPGSIQHIRFRHPADAWLGGIKANGALDKRKENPNDIGL